MFVLICIDENRHNIPEVVDRVPMIITSTRSIFIEDDIAKFLTMLGQQRMVDNKSAGHENNGFIGQGNGDQRNMMNGPPTNQPVDNMNIMAYSQLEMGSGFSDKFSYVTLNNDNDNDTTKKDEAFVEHSFATINQDNRFHMVEESNENSGSKIDSSILEKYIAQRDNEFSNVMKNRQKFT